MYYGQDKYFNLHHTFVDVRPVYRYFKAFKDTISEKMYLDIDTVKILSEKVSRY